MMISEKESANDIDIDSEYVFLDVLDDENKEVHPINNIDARFTEAVKNDLVGSGSSGWLHS